MSVEDQVRDLFKEEPIHEQDEIYRKIDAPQEEIRSTLKSLMEAGKISYTLDYKLSGYGSDYTEGIIEE